MAEVPISLNIAYFPDPVKGQPLALADVYIGQPDLDPEVLANRVEVIVVQESGTRVIIATNEQPLQTGAGGVILYQGSPVVVRAEGAVSIKVLRNGGGQPYYVPRANEVLDTAITNEGVLVLNGSFEVETVPTIPDNWTLSPGTNGTVEVDATTASHGIKSLKFVGTDITGGGTATSNRFNVDDGGDLDVRFTYKCTAATALNSVDVKYYDIGGAPVATITAYSEGVANPVNFTSFVSKVTGPAGGVTAEVILTGVDGTGTTVNATTRFDDILIVPVPVETNLNDVNVSNDLDVVGDISGGSVTTGSPVTTTEPINIFVDTGSGLVEPQPNNDLVNHLFLIDYGLSSLLYAHKTFDFTSQVTSARASFIFDNGTKMVAIDYQTTLTVYQYNLTIANDPSSAVYASLSYDASTEITFAEDISIVDGGTKMMILDASTNTFYQYTLSTANDVSSATYASKSLTFTTQDTTVVAARIGNNGATLLAAGNLNDTVYQYTLTNYDLSTGVYASKSFSTGAQEAATACMCVSDDGQRVYVSGTTNDTISEYEMTTPWDASTGAYTGRGVAITNPIDPRGLDLAGGYLVVNDVNGVCYQHYIGSVTPRPI